MNTIFESVARLSYAKLFSPIKTSSHLNHFTIVNDCVEKHPEKKNCLETIHIEKILKR